MEAFRKLITFLIGATLVVLGILDSCPRVGTVIIGLLLMGVFTVTEAIDVFRR